MALSTEEVSRLDDVKKQRYMLLERLFEHDGWNLLVGWANMEAAGQLVRLINALTWEDSRLAAGARAAFMMMASIEEIMEVEFRGYANEAIQAEVEAEEDKAANEAGNQ